MPTKDKIERICREAGMRPERRESYKGVEIFIADGFSLYPHQNYHRFGVDPEEFPGCMYVTLWWVSKDQEKLDVGQPLFFKSTHNPEYSGDTKKLARINTARREAMRFVDQRRKISANGLH